MKRRRKTSFKPLLRARALDEVISGLKFARVVQTRESFQKVSLSL